ncbi:MAG TPA: glycoside hydrolase family 3 N-terminal domain-containing protein [Polyangiaceae bacterium]|nr:glycoside hydrolase family 3 N-terminal domain-containing protein [Polyangiaceae bacterium]
MPIRFAAATLLLVACSSASGQSTAPATASAPEVPPAAPTRIDALIAQMTLEEKAGQLTQWGVQQSPTGPLVRQGGEGDIRQGHVGSLLGAFGVEGTRRLQKIAVEESRLKVPLLFAFDVIHGFRTVFPVPLAEAASFDPGLAERCARAAAVEASAHGLHWTYAPMVDIARDPRWGRVVEGAGEDPYLGAALAVARVRGFRGKPGAPDSMLATAKHFVAYGGAEGGRDYNTVDVSERTLHEVFLPPFRAAVEAGVDSIMPAFNEVAGTPMHAHSSLVGRTLREQWGFAGVVVSDYTGIMELKLHGIAATDAEAATRAIEASVDIDMISGIYLEQLPGLVNGGKLPMADVDAAVRRVLEAKERLGLFEDPYRQTSVETEQAHQLAPDARALAREAARESIVLLKNEGNLLPLKKQLASLAVVGELAHDRGVTLGTWRGAGRPEDTVTVLDGIQQALPKTKVLYARGASPKSDLTTDFAEAERIARGADAVLLVVGEGEDMSGEARSRSSIGLPGAQQALFDRLQKLGKPLVVLLVNGRALAISEVAERAQAILEVWQLGHEMGHAVADVLFGDVNPSGKLPVTFPRSTGQVPLYYNHKQTGRPAQEIERYTSKYIDVPWTPQFPFGHGLSYTTFSYDRPQLSATSIGPTEPLTVSVRVTNTGDRHGTEVVQLYLRDDAATFTRPVRELRGFRRVMLPPGKAEDVKFTLDADDLALYDEHLARVVEAGTFTVFVGGSSDTTNQAAFEVTKGAALQGLGSAIPRELR